MDRENEENSPISNIPGDRLRVTVWMRGFAPTPDQRTLLDRLKGLRQEGALADVSLRIWGRQIAASPSVIDGDDVERIRNRISEFESWASRNGYSLEPAFKRCEQTSMVSDERTEVVVLPTICLALYDADRLVGVFPCSDSDRTTTVHDCVIRLENASTGVAVDAGL
ncbi:HTH domain-containing protein [Halosolutus halophilus]|uniref:HTH domain-containing protein n=1 Tax=Halosolutus halophilus TaxID=1552990 RepID=UPI0022353015|nr:HTH domain-containing protein [Halosolutus halophilus]